VPPPPFLHLLRRRPQNWGNGNDFDNGYLFLPLEAARVQVAAGAWAGGLNLSAVADAEQRAFGYYHWYKNASSPAVAPYLMLNATQAGTASGLPKMPYLRDARRSGGGLGGFRLTYEALNGSMSGPSPTRGEHFNDTVGIGVYFYADIHRMSTCPYPPYLASVGSAPVLPYYIPFRALTVGGAPNLLVAGKAMSQTFWANAGTRLHPEEWISGVAAGAAAVLMLTTGWDSATLLANVTLLQALLASTLVQQPLDWTL
jgi:hypothetical protein